MILSKMVLSLAILSNFNTLANLNILISLKIWAPVCALEDEAEEVKREKNDS